MTDKQQVCERVVHTELSSLKCHNHMCLCDVMAHRRESRDTVAKEECMDVGRAASLRWMLAEKWTGRTGAFQRVPWQMWPSHVMPLLHTCYAGTSAPGGKGLFPPCAAVLAPPPRAPPKTVVLPPRAPPRPPLHPCVPHPEREASCLCYGTTQTAATTPTCNNATKETRRGTGTCFTTGYRVGKRPLAFRAHATYGGV